MFQYDNVDNNEVVGNENCIIVICPLNLIKADEKAAKKETITTKTRLLYSKFTSAQADTMMMMITNSSLHALILIRNGYSHFFDMQMSSFQL